MIAPMLWATGVGAEVICPMAVPVLGGPMVADELIDDFLPVLDFAVQTRRWRQAHRGSSRGPHPDHRAVATRPRRRPLKERIIDERTAGEPRASVAPRVKKSRPQESHRGARPRFLHPPQFLASFNRCCERTDDLSIWRRTYEMDIEIGGWQSMIFTLLYGHS